MTPHGSHPDSTGGAGPASDGDADSSRELINGLHRRTPSDLEWELNKLRESTREALQMSWAEVERLQKESAAYEERSIALQAQIEEIKRINDEEEAAAMSPTEDAGASGEDSNAPPEREGGMGPGLAEGDVSEEIVADSNSPSNDHGDDDRDDGTVGTMFIGWGDPGVDTDDDQDDDFQIRGADQAAGTNRRKGGSGVEEETKKSDDESIDLVELNNQVDQIWGENGGRPSFNQVSEDSCNASADIAGGGRRGSIATTVKAGNVGGEAEAIDDLDGQTEEALLAQVAELEEAMREETSELERQIEERERGISALEETACTQESSVSALRSEFETIRNEMAREARGMDEELEMLRRQVEELQRQDADLDRELENAGRALRVREGSEARLEGDLSIVSDELVVLRRTIPSSRGGNEGGNDGEGEGEHPDDVSALTLDSSMRSVISSVAPSARLAPVENGVTGAENIVNNVVPEDAVAPMAGIHPDGGLHRFRGMTPRRSSGRVVHSAVSKRSA